MTAGQDSDIIQAPALIEGLDPDMVIADKAYDANDFIQMIQDMGAMVVIPVRSNRNQQPECDYHWYKDLNLVERFFNKIKQFRRIATRYEKLDRNFMSMLNLVPSSGWRECSQTLGCDWFFKSKLMNSNTPSISGWI